MVKVGVKEMKNNLSRFLARVKQGEDVVITERGKPIARIVKESDARSAVYAALSDLVEKGIVTLPSKSLEVEAPTAIKTIGKAVSEMVVEDRR
jgi:prevent-host-death family protein